MSKQSHQPRYSRGGERWHVHCSCGWRAEADARRTPPTSTEPTASVQGHVLEDGLAWGPGYADPALVFTREDDSSIHPERLTQMFDKHVKASGLPSIRLHDLRHTYASLAL